MQAGVASVTEKNTSFEKGESTCPSWLRAGTSAILPPAASKIVMLNCASKATIRPLTVTEPGAGRGRVRIPRALRRRDDRQARPAAEVDGLSGSGLAVGDRRLADRFAQ